MGSASSDIDSYVYRVGYYNVSSKVSIKQILNTNSIHPIYACYPSYHYYITQPTMNYFKTFILHFPTYRLLKKGTDEGRLLSPVQHWAVVLCSLSQLSCDSLQSLTCQGRSLRWRMGISTDSFWESSGK